MENYYYLYHHLFIINCLVKILFGSFLFHWCFFLVFLISRWKSKNQISCSRGWKVFWWTGTRCDFILFLFYIYIWKTKFTGTASDYNIHRRLTERSSYRNRRKQAVWAETQRKNIHPNKVRARAKQSKTKQKQNKARARAKELERKDDNESGKRLSATGASL